MRNYEHTVNVLLDAYNNGTLFHGFCAACAVGNMIACSNNYKVKAKEPYIWRNIWPMWRKVFETREKGIQHLNLSKYHGRAKEEIDSTGYSIDELAAIEHAFESSIHRTKEGYDYWTDPQNEKQGQFMGLCAVLDVLADIHKEDDINPEASKTRLTEIYESHTCI